MKQLVYFFDELKTEHKHLAGGKGRTLAYLYWKGYPVPDGFIIMPDAFDGNDELSTEAWAWVQKYLEQMRKDDNRISFAIRSSALSEDSLAASFAGQFKTVLGVSTDNDSTDNEIWKAIQTVRRSRYSEKVRTYSEASNISISHDMAVVVQRFIQADISGVLFTADPLSGNRDKMTGNFIFGIGEKLVSGQINPYTFKLHQSSVLFRKVNYSGPLALKPFAGKLYKLANQLEKELGCPQDIEWAIFDRKLYLLQSRPITTLIGHNSVTGDWNDSMTGDYLWSNVNFGEAMSQVMTPLSWTVQQRIFDSWKILKGYQVSGNIGGRLYLNISIFASVLHVLGKNKQEILEGLEGNLYTKIPPNMEIPMIPLPKRAIIPVLFNLIHMKIKQNRAVRKLPKYLAENPVWCDRMVHQIQKAKNKEELHSLWNNEIEPHLLQSIWSVMGSVSHFTDYTIKLRRELTELIGSDDADTLILSTSNSLDVKDESELLASLGPLLGVARLASGEMERSEYMVKYGHRGPNEFELSVPRPAEESGWLDEQIEQLRESPIDVEALLIKRRERFFAAWNRFLVRYPRKAHSMRQRIDKVAPRARLREAVRSEYVRDRWVVRTFALRAGQLTGLKDDIFFLTIEELLDFLSGDESAGNPIPRRKESFRRLSALPPYPPIILGRFNPYLWAEDPKRQNDIYNDSDNEKREMIIGSPGSAGRIEGIVRRLDNPGEGAQLKKGEILVASQTDVSWTLLFPRAAAIVTDVGAPLSHAVIVARELGIPAVVGCGNATTRLHTGDHVLVDGGQGIVVVL